MRVQFSITYFQKVCGRAETVMACVIDVHGLGHLRLGSIFLGFPGTWQKFGHRPSGLETLHSLGTGTCCVSPLLRTIILRDRKEQPTQDNTWWTCLGRSVWSAQWKALPSVPSVLETEWGRSSASHLSHLRTGKQNKCVKVTFKSINESYVRFAPGNPIYSNKFSRKAIRNWNQQPVLQRLKTVHPFLKTAKDDQYRQHQAAQIKHSTTSKALSLFCLHIVCGESPGHGLGRSPVAHHSYRVNRNPRKSKTALQLAGGGLEAQSSFFF